MQQEIWKNIKGYEKYYQISSTGKIKSLERKDARGYLRKEKIRKLIKGSTNGYVTIKLMVNKTYKHYLFHRLLAEAFIPNPENKPEVNHKDGNKFNNNISNLEWVNRTENINHAFKNGLMNDRHGIGNSQTKLTEKQVLEIRKLYPKFKQKELAKKYNVYFSTICKIINRKTWKHI